MKKSTHFNERWRERVGGRPPAGSRFDDLVNDSVRIQRHRDCYTPRGRRLCVLGLYWNAKRNVVLKVDEKTNTVVTVLTPDAAEGG